MLLLLVLIMVCLNHVIGKENYTTIASKKQDKNDKTKALNNTTTNTRESVSGSINNTSSKSVSNETLSNTKIEHTNNTESNSESVEFNITSEQPTESKINEENITKQTSKEGNKSSNEVQTKEILPESNTSTENKNEIQDLKVNYSASHEMDSQESLEGNVTSSNIDSDENGTESGSMEANNESTTTETNPYTDEEGLIDVVADNGIKYMSTSSDEFLPRSGHESGNFAGITDDSEPMHYVISGESDLSKGSDIEGIGIEELLPDYVKPTVKLDEDELAAGGGEEEEKKVDKEDEIVLSESVETTTVEVTTWFYHSREFRGENFESSDEEKTTTVNPDEELEMEYRDEEEGLSNRTNTNTTTTIKTTLPPTTYKTTPKSKVSEEMSLTKEEDEDDNDDVFGEKKLMEDYSDVEETTIDIEAAKRNGEKVVVLHYSGDESDSEDESEAIKKESEYGSSSDSESSRSNAEQEIQEHNEENIANITVPNSSSKIIEINKWDSVNNDNDTATKINSSRVSGDESQELTGVWKNNSDNPNSSINFTPYPVEDISQHNFFSGANNNSSEISSSSQEITEHDNKDSGNDTTPTNTNNSSKHSLYSNNENNEEYSEPKNRTKRQDMEEKNIEKEVERELEEEEAQKERGAEKQEVIAQEEQIGVEQMESTTVFTWPKHSWENHGDLYEPSSEDKNTVTTSTMNRNRTSEYTSEEIQYSEEDLSIGVRIMNSDNEEAKNSLKEVESPKHYENSNETVHIRVRRDLNRDTINRVVLREVIKTLTLSQLKRLVKDRVDTYIERKKILDKKQRNKKMKPSFKVSKEESSLSFESMHQEDTIFKDGSSFKWNNKLNDIIQI